MATVIGILLIIIIAGANLMACQMRYEEKQGINK